MLPEKLYLGIVNVHVHKIKRLNVYVINMHLCVNVNKYISFARYKVKDNNKQGKYDVSF